MMYTHIHLGRDMVVLVTDVTSKYYRQLNITIHQQILRSFDAL